MEIKLQALLLRLFGVEVPLLRCQTKPLPAPEARIVAMHDGGFGDAWSGFVHTYTTTLENFTRPDTGEPLIFSFTHSEHDLSGQIDRWEGEINNILPTEHDAFADLVHIANAGLYPNNHLQTRVYINGVRIKMLRLDEEG